MRDVDAQYDPTAAVMMEEGAYPAHVQTFEVREDHPTKVGNADIFSLTYKIAQEAEKMSQHCYKRAENGNFAVDKAGKRIPVILDGTHLEVKCDKFVGRKLYSNGLFLFKGSEGSGRNSKYTEFLEAIGVKLEEIDVDGHKVKKLMAIEAEDVVGKPVFAKVMYKENNKHQWFPTVVDILPWEDGVEISAAEMEEDDLPF